MPRLYQPERGKVTPPEKTCTSCKETKPETEFGFYSRKTKRLPHCKPCARAMSRDYYRAKNPEARHIAETITEEGRVCTTCNKFKTWDSFPKLKSSGTGHRPYCRACRNLAQRRERATARPSPLGEEAHAVLYAQQNGTCAICPSTGRLSPHTHPATSAVHLLCTRCLDCATLHADRLRAVLAYLTPDHP
jgi:hypothetical protein